MDATILPWRLTRHVCLSALLLYVATSGGSLTSSDAVVAFDLTRSLVEHRSVALSGNLLGREENRGVDGRYYSQFGIAQSVYSMPFYAAARGVQQLTGLRAGKADSITKAAVALGSTVVAAATVATVFLFAWVVTRCARASVMAALACAAGSLLWPYARFGFNAPLAAWLVTAAAAALYVGVRHHRRGAIVLSGCLIGIGCLTRHEFVLLAVPLAAWIFWSARGPADEHPAVMWVQRGIGQTLLFAPGVIAGMALWAIYNHSRFGRYTYVGYSPTYALDGYYGLLFTPAGSVLLYSPTIVLGLAGLAVLMRRSAGSVWLVAGPAITLFLFYGALDDWAGGRSYGPRYLVPVLPLLTVPIAAIFAWAPPSVRRFAGAVVAVAVLLQLPGVLVDYSRVGQTWAQTASQDDLQNRRYRWTAAPILLNSVAAGKVLTGHVHSLSAEEAKTIDLDPALDQRNFAQQFDSSLDFWWLHLRDMGAISTGLAWAIGAILVFAMAAMAERTRRLAIRLDLQRSRETSK